MKSSNTFAVSFCIKRQKVRNGQVPIYLRITVNGERAEMAIKRYVEPEFWNEAKGEVRGKRQEVKSLNTYMEQLRFRITEIYQDYIINKKLVSAEAIKNTFLGNDEEEEYTLCKLIDFHNTVLRETLQPGTMKNYFTTQKYVQKFLKDKIKKADIPLSQLRYNFIIDFSLFLKKHKPVDHQKPCGQNTIMKHIERLRKMINLAIKNEWMTKDPFVKFKPHFIKYERGFLTQEELKTIEEKDFAIERVQLVKDLFIFSCYTGLSYSDVIELDPSHLVKGQDGKLWIHTKRLKTDIHVKIPLLDQALRIIDKYKDHPGAVSNQTVFPKISNQKLNSYLKEVADVCGINKNLTFHLARHTFATTITLTNGVPIESVSKLLGHSSIRTTQIYAKVVENKLSKDMSRLNKKLSSL